LDLQLKEWQWSLDANLPEPFGKIGRWLAQAEKLLSQNDVPVVMDDEAARKLNHAIEAHKVSRTFTSLAFLKWFWDYSI